MQYKGRNRIAKLVTGRDDCCQEIEAMINRYQRSVIEKRVRATRPVLMALQSRMAYSRQNVR